MAALLLYGYRTTCGFYAAVRIAIVTSLRPLQSRCEIDQLGSEYVYRGQLLSALAAESWMPCEADE
ncbi:MAG TPA: hypothetical protein VHY80_09445 [Stellaceae bacterium]|nr:hypothetical protein [Stellaceae bacterium]